MYVPDFLPAEFTARLIAAVDAVTPVGQSQLPAGPQAGRQRQSPQASISSRRSSRSCTARRRCCLAAALTGDRLQLSPADDPHAYALYFYSRPGDHIGWHYDTSYYSGRRYTLLLGVVDRSTCRLDYELHTKTAGRRGAGRIDADSPGGLVLFDGDKLRHRITPIGKNEFRVSLTFEYVTSQHMSPWWRFVSNMKDAVAYFGFRQVFSRMARGRAPTP